MLRKRRRDREPALYIVSNGLKPVTKHFVLRLPAQKAEDAERRDISRKKRRDLAREDNNVFDGNPFKKLPLLLEERLFLFGGDRHDREAAALKRRDRNVPVDGIYRASLLVSFFVDCRIFEQHTDVCAFLWIAMRIICCAPFFQ